MLEMSMRLTFPVRERGTAVMALAAQRMFNGLSLRGRNTPE
jgi:hypothetical protein